MSNGAKWLIGLIILGLISLLLSVVGPWSAIKRSNDLGAQLNQQLDDNGFAWANVEMAGNVAKLTGEAKSEAARQGALDFVENAECEKCAGKTTWHEAEDDGMTVAKVQLPIVSPYVFNAAKSENGQVVLSGVVGSPEDLKSVTDQANTLFGSNWRDNKLTLAAGAPSAQWREVIGTNLDDLAKLDFGKVTMTDAVSVLTGGVNDVAIRDAIEADYAALPAPFEGAASIETKGAAASTAPEVTSQGVCQVLFNELKGDNEINFAYNKAEISGAESFDLLNKLADAANKCASFRIAVDGHTDADGAADYNQWLSEARATTVVLYLADSGVERSRMTATGFGETKPVGDNATDAGKEQNRRIEFTVSRSE